MFQMVSHGLVSGALFLCVGVIYDRMHTREIAAYGGLVQPDAALRGRLHGLHHGQCGPARHVGLRRRVPDARSARSGPIRWVAFFATTGVILSAAYALWLYRRVIFGVLEKPALQAIPDLDRREIVILAPLVAARHLLRRPARPDPRRLRRVDATLLMQELPGRALPTVKTARPGRSLRLR